ncbi:hypothetical protein C4J96_2145 [Pseudomonas orientalis]|nr:hypothetical protein C4J96_2145 [Pseudomonas orientalis]
MMVYHNTRSAIAVGASLLAKPSRRRVYSEYTRCRWSFSRASSLLQLIAGSA